MSLQQISLLLLGLSLACTRTVQPTQSQTQNQNQGQNQSQTSQNTNTNQANSNAVASGGNSSSNSSGGNVNNYVESSQGDINLPTAPLANCDSSAAISIGGAVGRDSGFIPTSTTTLYVAATIPIGKRHCEQTYPPAPPITNIYYTNPPAAIILPQVQTKVITQTKTVYRRQCTQITPETKLSLLAQIHRLRHTRQNDRIAQDLQTLHAACVSDAILAKAIDD